MMKDALLFSFEVDEFYQEGSQKETCHDDAQKKMCPHTGLNYGPLHYKCNALPLSYKGFSCGCDSSDNLPLYGAIVTTPVWNGPFYHLHLAVDEETLISDSRALVLIKHTRRKGALL